MSMAGTYPVGVDFPIQETYNRLWAIPIFGAAVKALILIPHLIVLSVLLTVVMLLQYVLWIFVLMGGRYPDWGYRFVGGTMRWSIRVSTYYYGFSDQYPPFTFDGSIPGHADITWEEGQSANLFWAVPVLGLAVKLVILIPHIVILYALSLVAGLLALVTWVPVLFTGQYPEWGRSLIGGYLRWYTRVALYLLGLTDRYPPFQLGV
jgi:hypothetical protein